MTSFGVKAEMEQCAQNHVKLSTSCGTPESANGNSTKDDSHDQKLMKKESPNSPSPVKRWEIGPLLQSFKSKMASFTEIVMSPVRLFKPTDTLSSIMPPDQHEQLSLESTTCTEGSETTDDKCKNVLLSKRPSSERMQCNSPPKRHRVAQRLSFETVSTSNHESVLECNEMHSDEGVATSEDQTERPAGQRETAYQEGEFDLHFSATQSTVLHSDLTESPDKPKNSSSTSTDGSGHKESCVQATRKSPRKMFKRISETAAELASGPKALDESIKDFHSIIVKERKHLSKKISDTSNSTSVGLVRPKRCRQALRTETKEDMAAKCKHEFQKSEGVGMRREKDKKFKDSSITLEMSEEDVICVQMRKRRKGISTEQILQSPDIGLDTTGIEIRNSETVESCESTEMKKMGHEKTSKTNFRRNKKYKVLQTSNDVDTNPSSQIVTGNIVLDKTLHISIINTLNDGYYENSKQTGLQIHEAEESKARKLRQHVFKSARKASSQKRSLCPPKHKFEDFSITPVVDPAGPSGPSKRKLYQSDRSCEELQRAFTLSEKQMTSLSNSEFDKNRLGIPSVHPLSRVLLQSEKEAKPNRQVKTATRQKRKQRKTRAEDKAKIPEKMMEAIPVESLSGSGSNRLLRSFSCPELPSLIFSDCHAPPSHTHEKCSTSPTKESTAIPLPVHIHSLSKRTRRHTVCSVEIEREFAPLCLRKEVYPATRGGPSSPSNSLTALTLFFLSSPLAFLSKSSSHSDTSRFTSSYVTPSSPSLCSSPYASTLKSSDPVTDPSTVSTPSPEIPSVSSLCSLSQSALGGDQGILQMECGRALDEDRSSFSLQLSTVISEEKALSDSEIRSDNKEGQRGKVSSIRICKRMPKPQNNLTPMGLPKVIRIKKKDFSLEEIYTNKNFCKPPDGRLETIFEVPLNRRDGSQVVVSQKKIKRFVEFPELGVARKPKKPLVGGTAGVGAQRKAGGYSGICRTRRGVGTSSKGEDGLNLQELDSLLCSKLQELDTWIALQQVSC